ncbi:hypothetical protein BHM03_00056820 [Ensete ventricosum]|nr:hypothetical protein BHM03_00056820 [Ensete ventricosum]
MAPIEKRAIELSAKVEQLKLKDLRDSWRRLEDEVLTLARDVEALRSVLKSTGAKVITNYKEAQGFQFGL